MRTIVAKRDRSKRSTVTDGSSYAALTSFGGLLDNGACCIRVTRYMRRFYHTVDLPATALTLFGELR